MGEAPTPSVVIDAATIKATGNPNIADVLVQMPSIQPTRARRTNSNFLTSGYGVSNINRAHLGCDRTLVLVNGQRWVTGSPTSTAVDLNTIPTQLIQPRGRGHGRQFGGLRFGCHRRRGQHHPQGRFRGDSGQRAVRQDLAQRRRRPVLFAACRRQFPGRQGQRHHVGDVYENSRRSLFRQPRPDADGRRPLSGLLPLLRHRRLHVPWRCRLQLLYAAGRYVCVRQRSSTRRHARFSGSYNPDGSTFHLAADGFDRNPNRLIAGAADPPQYRRSRPHSACSRG